MPTPPLTIAELQAIVATDRRSFEILESVIDHLENGYGEGHYVRAEDYTGVDIGEQINNAVIDAAALGRDVRVSHAVWHGQSFSTPIVCALPNVKIYFPSVKSIALYIGAVAAFHLWKSGNGLYNMGVDLAGAAANTDGLLIGNTTGGSISDLRFMNLSIQNAKRHGIMIDSADQGVYNVTFDGVTRSVVSTLDNLHITGIGAATPNGIFFNHLVSNGALRNGVNLHAGYNNIVRGYLQAQLAGTWALVSSATQNAIGPLTIDATVVDGIQITAGKLFITGLNNNATGVALDEGGVRRLFYITQTGDAYFDQVYGISQLEDRVIPRAVDLPLDETYNNAIVTNEGASAAVNITLPEAIDGRCFRFTKIPSQVFTVTGAATDNGRMRLGTTVTTAGTPGILTLTSTGSFAELRCVQTGVWYVHASDAVTISPT